MNTYLSLDLDFFDSTDVPGNLVLLREILLNMRNKEIPVEVVMSHEDLVFHMQKLKRLKLKRLINLDEHSDSEGLYTCTKKLRNGRTSRVHRPSGLHCGNWVDHVPFARTRLGEYVWVTPPGSPGSDCYDIEAKPSWRKKRKLSWGSSYTKRYRGIPWGVIVAGGIAMSPDYTARNAYMDLRRVVTEFYPLPVDSRSIEQHYLSERFLDDEENRSVSSGRVLKQDTGGTGIA